MTYGEALLASCMRSTLVMAAGIVMSQWLAGWHRSTASTRQRRSQIVLLAMLFLTPNLIVGFGYRTLSINLLNHRWLNELLYLALICFEFVPAAVWLLLHSPPPSLSAEAWHCARLARRDGSPLRSWAWRLRFWWGGAGETCLGPAALLFVLSFQESELAALMQVAGWPERLFTDHVRGLPPSETVRLVAWPVMIQIPFLIPLVSRLRAATSTPSLSVLAEKSRIARRCGAGSHLLGWTWISAGLLLVIGRPLWHLVDGLLRAGRTVALQPRWWREVGDAVLLAGTCAAITWGVAWFSGGFRGKVSATCGVRQAEPALRWKRWVHLLAFIPGLMGTLTLGLLTAGFFQRWLPGLAYTPAPLVVAECLWLWPRVVLVRQSIAARTRIAGHQVALLQRSPDARQAARGAKLWWKLAGRPVAGGLLLIGWWCYLEVMLPMILSSPGFQPAPMMMYNHLHYAQVEALGVKLAMILSVPFFVGGCLGFALRIQEGRADR